MAKKKKNTNVVQLTSVIKLDKKYNEILTAISFSAKYLYNEFLYAARQNYFNHTGNPKSDSTIKFENSFADFKDSDVYHYAKNLKNYGLIPASASQNVCLAVNQDMRSFFGLLSLKQSGEYKAKVNLPHYKKKEDLFTISLTTGNFRKQDSKITLTTPKSITYYNPFIEEDITVERTEKITFTLPPYLIFSKINMIEIVPKFGGFYAHIVYEKAKEIADNLDDDKYLSIDMGVNNFATTIKSNGEAIIYSGKGMKSANQFYNKVKAKLDSRKAKSKSKQEKDAIQKQIWRISEDRQGYLKTKIHSIAIAIIEDAIENNIKNIVIGKNDYWKTEANMGVKNNQKFVMLPHSVFVDVLKYLAQMKGLKVTTVNESHTSKCDALASEPVQHQETYLGKRSKRGLFISSIKQLINADVNGALNILRKFLNASGKSLKYQKRILDEILSSGRFQRPRVLSL